MNYRNLGKTGMTVSEVGMGCNRLGDPMHEDEFWDNLVRRAIDLGVNNFDTSEAYGKGRSEEILGHVVGNRDDLFIASKASPKMIDGVRLITSEIIFEAVEKSLKRLQRDCIDIYQLHSPNQDMLERDDWAEGLLRLREQGKIKHCAIAVNSANDGIWAIEHGVAEVLQITYSIFETTPEEKLFDLAKKHGVGLLVRRPMERGVLTGKFKPNQAVASEHRASLEKDRLPGMIERAETLRAIGEAYPGGMTRMALQFSLGPDAVSCIIPGARKIEQVEENVVASYGGGFSANVRAQIDIVRKAWEV